MAKAGVSIKKYTNISSKKNQFSHYSQFEREVAKKKGMEQMKCMDGGINEWGGIENSFNFAGGLDYTDCMMNFQLAYLFLRALN